MTLPLPDRDSPRSSAAQPSLARRISGRTSNLLATGIVLAAALGVGRQLVQWWRIDSRQPVTPPVSVSAADGQQPFEIAFNSGYALRRIELQGDLAAATERLRAECREILESSRATAVAPTAGEQRFLARTAGRPPLEERAGKWQIHQFDGQLPLLVAVKVVDSPGCPRAAGQTQTAPAGALSPVGTKPAQLEGSPAAPSTRGASRLHNARVLAWGLAMPTDERAYTLLVYEAGGEAAEGHAPPEFPLPDCLRRTLTLRGQGGASIGLAGDLPPARIRLELDEFLSSRNFRSTGWRQLGAAWHNRYWAHSAASQTLDIQLTDNHHGGVTGLLITNN